LVLGRSQKYSRGMPNSLHASGGSASHNLLGAAKGAVMRGAASTQTLYGFWFFYGVAYHVHTVKVRDVLKLLRNDGWVLVTTAGSHRQFKHPTKSGRVTVAGHPSDDLHPKTLKSILTQAGMKK